MYTRGTLVSLKKIGVVADAPFPTPDKEDYVPGIDNGDVTIPVEYEITGTLATSGLKVGQRLLINRRSRNGIAADGSLWTSPVKEIRLADNGVFFDTMNSVYYMEKIGE
jgi:hypothetical protein